jgi:TolA-binding protein
MRGESEIISGPDRKMSMAAEQKPELEKELGEIRREVIEARNLVIKTDNLLKNLHAEVKTIGKRHEDLHRRTWISSGVAYVVFAVLCAAGAMMVSSARTSTAGQERERLEKAVAELTGQLEKQRAEVAATQGSQRAAAEVFRMMTSLPGDERLKGVDELMKLDTSRLTPLERHALNDKAEQLRREVGSAAFERGKQAFRRNDMGATIEELSRFLAMNPPEAEQLDAAFFLGTAYNQVKKHEQAVPLLARFVTGDKKSKNRDYAMLMLAQSYQETNQLEKALQTAQEAVEAYPGSQFAPQLRGRMATVRRLISGGGEAAPGPAAAPQPAAARPAAPPATSPSGLPTAPPPAAPPAQTQ